METDHATGFAEANPGPRQVRTIAAAKDGDNTTATASASDREEASEWVAAHEYLQGNKAGKQAMMRPKGSQRPACSLPASLQAFVGGYVRGASERARGGERDCSETAQTRDATEDSDGGI